MSSQAPSSKTPERIREWILLATRDILPPLTGVFFSVYLPVTGQFEAWQLPLIAGLFGIPLVAPRQTKDPS